MKKRYYSLELEFISLSEQDVLTNSQEQGSYGADGEDDYGFDFWE